MSNLQQNKIQNGIEQFKIEINLWQDKLKQSKKNKVYCKMDKSKLQKCKPKKDIFHRKSKKCIIKYRIYFKTK